MVKWQRQMPPSVGPLATQEVRKRDIRGWRLRNSFDDDEGLLGRQRCLVEGAERIAQMDEDLPDNHNVATRHDFAHPVDVAIDRGRLRFEGIVRQAVTISHAVEVPSVGYGWRHDLNSLGPIGVEAEDRRSSPFGLER